MELRLVYQLEGACLFDSEILDMRSFVGLDFKFCSRFVSSKPRLLKATQHFIQLNSTFQLIPKLNFVVLAT